MNHLQENFKKVLKLGAKHDQLAQIAGNTQQSSPVFIKLINKNLSKGYAIDRPVHSVRSNSENNGEWQLNHLNIPESQLKHNTDEIRELKKLKDGSWKQKMEASCISNNEKQEYVIFKEYLHFWNLSLEPANFNHNSSGIQHISIMNRKCSTDKKSIFCCKEITKNLKDLTNKTTNVCNDSKELTNCHEFCINIDPENGYFINCTKYPCQEGYKSSFPTFIDWIQTTVYNKTSAIIFGRNENAENPEFQTWAHQMIQNLDIALVLNNQNSTATFPEEQSSNIIFLNQWIEFLKFNETTIDQELAWQLLNQQYDGNISSNLIRICIINQKSMAQIICTEQYYYNVCRFDDPTECIDDIFTTQTLVICRRLKLDDEKVVEITEIFCDSLNESIILPYFQHEAFQSTTDIIILQLIRATIIHSISATTTTTTTAVQLKDQHDRRSENIEEKQYKYANNIRLKSDGQAENTFEKIVKTSISKMSEIAQNSAKKKATFGETDYIFATTDSITMQMSSEVKKTNLNAPENSSEPDPVILETIPIARSNLTNLSETWQDFDDILNGTTTNTMNLNDVGKINVTVEIEGRSISDSAKKEVIKNSKISFLQRDKQSLWKPFHMDCSNERDACNAINCSNWAAAGYCLSNNATRFLWCRKTCLCIGPPQL
ncbi:unnamed protein product [Onchocerca ochengi]|uniref:ShKT domain-containing protein n=1 Tax=Onchocerca ochengi TaxID=42157 RepID=A0A182EFK1_ONCOC|nr:unnamed protein product [Onchocerca ochengi]